MSDALLDHARVALEYAGETLANLAGLRQRIAAGYHHRHLIDDALQDLRQRHERLQGLYAALRTATPDALAVRWQEFFAAYDAYLDIARDARSRLFTHDAFVDGVDDASADADRTSPEGGSDPR
jgi:hypothetical protein